MASELIRPGVEVIQQLRSASPSFTRPALVPCVVGPAFEVLNVLSSDGSLNSKALFGAYAQLGKSIAFSSFPDPRNNIDELTLQEGTTKPYMLFTNKLNELPVDDGYGSAFLAMVHRSGKAAIRTKVLTNSTDLTAKVLVFAIDQPARTDTSNDITITFSGVLTRAQIVEELNAAAGLTVASVLDDDRIQIASPSYGAVSSVTIRAGGSANAILELGYVVTAGHEERVEGSGWRGQDQSLSNTTVTPWIEFFKGMYLDNGVENLVWPANRIGQIGIETQTFANAKAATITFGDSAGQFPVKVGDTFYADGVRLKDGEVMKVESERFKVGTINTALSTADSNGNYITKVYDVQTVGTIFDTTPFAPVYSYFRAFNLDARTLAPTADSVTGTITGTAATAGSTESTSITFSPSIALAGTTLHYVVTVDGVATEGTFTFVGGPFLTVGGGVLGSDLVLAIGSNIPGVIASNNAGKLKLSTSATGRLQSVVVKADGTANQYIGFNTLTDQTGTGTDVEFYPVGSTTGGTQTFPFTYTTGETLVIESSADGGVTWTALTRTFTFAASFTAANISALLGLLNTAGSWNGATLPTTFTIGNVGDKLTVTTTSGGALVAVRIGSTSTAIGAAASSDLLFTANQAAAGTDLAGKELKFTLDYNPHVYDVVLTSPSLNLAVDAINELVGTTVASIAGVGADKLKITSPLAGLASVVTIQSTGAAADFGVATNGSSLGLGRPFPDAYISVGPLLHIGAEILREQVTGYPMDQTFSSGALYLQYKALRKDVTAMAKTAGVIRLSDVATLAQVLDPLTEDNPLGLGTFLCMINAPTFEVKALGVDEVTPAASTGTGLAWARALGLLEAEEVYALAPLTHDEVVHGLISTHVDVISQPEQGGERIAFISKVMPDRKNPSIALSGTQSNSTATVNQMLLDGNPAAGLVALGINPAMPIPETAMVYMEFEVGGELRRYSVSSVSGPLVSFRVAFSSAATNVDGFFSTTTMNTVVVNAAYKVAVRGESVVVSGSNPPKLDYSLVAETVAGANESFKNRRLFSVFPDNIKTVINGIEKVLPSYYASCCMAGMVGAQPPQQGFTNFPITGLTGVSGTENFTKRQQNVMAGGGTYILIQDVQGGAVTCRHQVSTDLTSIETRELSITKVVDFTAKILREAVRKFIGVNNVDTQLLDSLGTTIQAVLKFLEESGVLLGSNLNNIAQDSAAPDTVLVDVTIQVPYPCNYIRVVVVV